MGRGAAADSTANNILINNISLPMSEITTTGIAPAVNGGDDDDLDDLGDSSITNCGNTADINDAENSSSSSSYSASSSSSCTTADDDEHDHGDADDDEEEDNDGGISVHSSATGDSSHNSDDSAQREIWWQQQQEKLQVQLEEEQQQQEKEAAGRMRRSSSFSCLPDPVAEARVSGSSIAMAVAAARVVADEGDGEAPQIKIVSQVPTSSSGPALRRCGSSASDPGLGPKKSSLKRTSSYGSSKDTIPINRNRRAWKQMPPPSDPNAAETKSRRKRGLARVGVVTGVRRTRSTGSLERMARVAVQHKQQEQQRELEALEKQQDPNNSLGYENQGSNKNATWQAGRRMPRRRVSFGSVGIREHTLTIGDNPSCRAGAPTSLDWEYDEKDTVHVESYEFTRRPIRKTSSRELKMNATLRRRLLLEIGKSEAEISDAAEEAQKIRKQREFTKEVMLPLANVEAVVQSATRKAKRLIPFAGKGKS